MSVEDFITLCNHFEVEDLCQTIVKQPLRGRGFMPKLSNAKVITMDVWVNSWKKTMTRAYGAIFVITGMTGFLTWVREPTLPNKAPTYGS